MHELLAMGGYAVYVWPAYGLTLLALVWNIWLPLRAYRKLRRELVQDPAGPSAGQPPHNNRGLPPSPHNGTNPS